MNEKFEYQGYWWLPGARQRFDHRAEHLPGHHQSVDEHERRATAELLHEENPGYIFVIGHYYTSRVCTMMWALTIGKEI